MARVAEAEKPAPCSLVGHGGLASIVCACFCARYERVLQDYTTCSEGLLHFFYSDKFVPVGHSLQDIATRANTNPEAKRTHTQRKRKCEPTSAHRAHTPCACTIQVWCRCTEV